MVNLYPDGLASSTGAWLSFNLQQLRFALGQHKLPAYSYIQAIYHWSCNLWSIVPFFLSSWSLFPAEITFWWSLLAEWNSFVMREERNRYLSTNSSVTILFSNVRLQQFSVYTTYAIIYFCPVTLFVQLSDRNIIQWPFLASSSGLL